MTKTTCGKIAAVVALCVATMSLAFTSSAQAQNGPSASLETLSSSVEPGDSITVSLSLDVAGLDYTAGLYQVGYDPSVVLLESCIIVPANSGICNEAINPALAGHFVTINPLDPAPFPGGVIAELQFDVAADAAPGTSTVLDLEVIDFFVSDEIDIGDDVVAIDSTITIVEPPVLPDPGTYYLQNVGSGRWLDADSGKRADTSSSPKADDRWELQAGPQGDFYLRNVTYNQWLDTDRSADIDLSTSTRGDDVWRVVPAADGAFLLEAVQRGGYLVVANNDVERSSQIDSFSEWRFELVDDGPGDDPGIDEFVGSSIALQNVGTSRWLDGDPGNVDQSVSQRDDDVWVVSDAGDGYVNLRNAVTKRFLDSDGPNNNVDSSSTARSDDRWLIVDLGDGAFEFRSVDHDAALRADSDGGNVVTGSGGDVYAQWQIVLIGGQAA